MSAIIIVATFVFLFCFGCRMTENLDHFLSSSGFHNGDLSEGKFEEESEDDTPAESLYLTHRLL